MGTRTVAHVYCAPMSPPPKGKQMTTGPAAGPHAPRDWTSAVVGVALAFLAVLGVVTVLSSPLLALVAPPAPEEGPPAETDRAPHGSASVTDGGTSTTIIGRADRDAHS